MMTDASSATAPEPPISSAPASTRPAVANQWISDMDKSQKQTTKEPKKLKGAAKAARKAPVPGYLRHVEAQNAGKATTQRSGKK
jgi:hypothetical protein